MGIWILILALLAAVVLALSLLTIEIAHYFDGRRYRHELDDAEERLQRTYGNAERIER